MPNTLTHDYLGLRLNRLKPSEEWSGSGEGLVFIFPSGGKGNYVAGPIAHPFGAGDVLVFNLSSVGKICVEDGRDLLFRSFSLQLKHLFPLFANHEVHMLQDLEDRFKDARLYQGGTPVAVECHRFLASAPPLFNLDHRSHLLRIAAAVFSAELTNSPVATTGQGGIDEHMEKVLDELSTDQILGLSIDELAAKVHCSRRHLNRLFHNRFGFSVSALRMELRLIKAASLLRDANAKVIHVAEQSGFNHLGLFNTRFKRRFGVSPGQWRKQPQPPERRPHSLPGLPKCSLLEGGLCPMAGELGNADGAWTKPSTAAPNQVAVHLYASKAGAAGPADAAGAKPVKYRRAASSKVKVRLSA